jgi:hypothetical protein
MPAWLIEALAGPTTTIAITGRALKLSRNATYEAARRGEIPTLRFGKRIVVPTAWLRRVLQVDTNGAEAA